MDVVVFVNDYYGYYSRLCQEMNDSINVFSILKLILLTKLFVIISQCHFLHKSIIIFKNLSINSPWYSSPNPDPLRSPPEPPRQNPSLQVVRALRRQRESKAAILNPPHDRDARLQTNQLPRIQKLQNHLQEVRRPLLYPLHGCQR